MSSTITMKKRENQQCLALSTLIKCRGGANVFRCITSPPFHKKKHKMSSNYEYIEKKILLHSMGKVMMIIKIGSTLTKSIWVIIIVIKLL